MPPTVSSMHYEHTGMQRALCAALLPFCPPGAFIIYRSAFRWMRYIHEADRFNDEVMPNHYECQDVPQLIEDHNHTLILDLHHVAVITPKTQE